MLSDTTGEVCQAYGACNSSLPKQVKRNTYVIDPQGLTQRIYENVDPESQAEIVLALLSVPLRQHQQAILSAIQVEAQANDNGAATDLEKGEQGIMDNLANDLDDEREPAIAVSSSSMISDSHNLGRSQTVSSKVQPAHAGDSSLVYALGMIGCDLVSEARRDSIIQHMEGPSNPNPSPYNPLELLTYLETNPSQAAAIIWTLNLDATPIYAIQPSGAFAYAGYERLRQFLREQCEEGVERVSIPGKLIGHVQLMSGQVVPVIWPELRTMYSWTTCALVEAICGKPPAKNAGSKEREAYAQKTVQIANFLERVYHESRNLGLTPQERAINYAATNSMIVEGIFEAAINEEMELDSIEVEPSPICRPDSECWDVKLTFFNPIKVFEQARKVYRFTIDVSDVCPVMVGKMRVWSAR